MMKIDYTKAWKLKGRAGDKALIVWQGQQLAMDNEATMKLIRGELVPTQPVHFEYNMGEVPYDLMETSYNGRYLVSERFSRMLDEGDFSGWQLYPVDVHGMAGEPIIGYSGLSITGRVGPVDYSRGQFLTEFPGTGIRMRGLYFLDDEWDGSDIVLSDLRVCVTQRLYDAVNSLCPGIVRFTRLDQTTLIKPSDENP